MDTFICRIVQAADGVRAQVTDVDHAADSLRVRTGCGDSTAKALTQALGLARANFATEQDELDSCIAALRDRALRISVDGRQIHSLGLV